LIPKPLIPTNVPDYFFGGTWGLLFWGLVGHWAPNLKFAGIKKGSKRAWKRRKLRTKK